MFLFQHGELGLDALEFMELSLGLFFENWVDGCRSTSQRWDSVGLWVGLIDGDCMDSAFMGVFTFAFHEMGLSPTRNDYMTHGLA